DAGRTTAPRRILPRGPPSSSAKQSTGFRAIPRDVWLQIERIYGDGLRGRRNRVRSWRRSPKCARALDCFAADRYFMAAFTMMVADMVFPWILPRLSGQMLIKTLMRFDPHSRPSLWEHEYKIDRLLLAHKHHSQIHPRGD